MSRLFAFYIGGAAPGSLVELHDVRFAIADRIEDTYETLRAGWWGTPESLHLDCWGELTSADGHNIVLRDYPAADDNRLWFVNLGGHDPADFTELHQNVFVVAPTASKAQVRALKSAPSWQSRHRDYVHEVENVFAVEDVVTARSGWHIHLEKTDRPAPFVFECGYWPIAKGKVRKPPAKA
jgi:hypothetical protein